MKTETTAREGSRRLPRILVTGGSGFLGKAIVNEFLQPSSPFSPELLRIFDVSPYTGPADPRIEYIRGDVRDLKLFSDACRDIDILIHSAAVVDWGTKPEEEIRAVNTGGTENAIKACLEQKVGILIYTSSLDAIFGGKPLAGIDETIPYPPSHPTSYCRSKYRSELLVTEAGSKGLKTCILRPADIWGELDPYHIGSLLAMAKGGFYVRLGDGTTKSQHVYVGNMAWAHLLAAKALWDGNNKVTGSIYFITDAPPSNFFKFFDPIVEAAGYRIWPKSFWIPRNIAFAMGFLSEMTAKMVSPFKKYTPKLSRFAVTYTCGDFTFNTDKAKREFGFIPKYSPEESFRRTVSAYKK
ncbi:MAG: NAD-dependent epimerase/dehydratase family protein [bacterium]